MDRFIKVSEAGALLAADAEEWVAVLDTSTNVMWTVEEIPVRNFTEAQEKAKALKIAGFTDWAAPSPEKLFCLADRTRVNPAINTDYFPDCKSDWYWTNQVYAPSPGCAWFVFFGNGGSGWGFQCAEGFVRACRPGQ